MKVYLVRHGQTDTNISNLYNFRGEDINQNGIQQAEKLKEKIKEMEFDIIYCSPLLRARHTADIINSKNKQVLLFLNFKLTDAFIGISRKYSHSVTKYIITHLGELFAVTSFVDSQCKTLVEKHQDTYFPHS